jgi:16S rRNA (cytidine1402-2'-O)-methyltransferase
MPGTLYIVATPIGNLEDLPPRAGRVLGEVSLIAAEDTRVTRKLLSHLGLHTPMLSYNEHNAAQRTPRILGALGEGDVALVCDAGTPVVSDPGAALVRAAADAGFVISPIPGPSAVTAALAAAGVLSPTFRFMGFPPRRPKARLAVFEAARASADTLVLYEAPHRLLATLGAMRDTFGERRIVVCRELTKRYEEIWRGTASAALAHFTEPRGEFAIVVEPAPPPEAEPAADDDAVRPRLAELQAEGISRRDASAQAAKELGVPRRDAYRLWPE